MNLIIDLDKHISKYNFLQNSAKYFFELDGKMWSSVNQYLQVIYHNKNTDQILGGLSYETDSATLTKNVSGFCDDDSLGVGTLNIETYETLLLKALLAKFKQNPKIKEALMNLKQFKIVAKSPNDLLAEYLEHVRDFLIKESQIVKTAKYVIPYPESDIPLNFKNLSVLDTKIITEILRTLKHVKDFYYEYHYHLDMIDTLFYNIFDKNKDIVVCLKRWLVNLSWNDISSKMPNFNSNIDQVDSLIKKSGFDRDYSLSFAIYIAIFLRWINYNERGAKKTIIKILENIKSEKDIVAIPLPSEFKNKIPSFIAASEPENNEMVESSESISESSENLDEDEDDDFQDEVEEEDEFFNEDYDEELDENEFEDEDEENIEEELEENLGEKNMEE